MSIQSKMFILKYTLDNIYSNVEETMDEYIKTVSEDIDAVLRGDMNDVIINSIKGKNLYRKKLLEFVGTIYMIDLDEIRNFFNLDDYGRSTTLSLFKLLMSVMDLYSDVDLLEHLMNLNRGYGWNIFEDNND